VCRTIIGFGLPTRQGTSKAHGEPPGDTELNAAKEKAAWPIEPRFYIPEEVLVHFRAAVSRGAQLEREWQECLEAYRKGYPDEAAELERRLWRVLLTRRLGSRTSRFSLQMQKVLLPAPPLAKSSMPLHPTYPSW
jgi:transketolase